MDPFVYGIEVTCDEEALEQVVVGRGDPVLDILGPVSSSVN